MFHELLMALNGITGSVFMDTPHGIKLSSLIPSLHPAEKNILERLCALATKYKQLYEFQKKHTYHGIGKKHEIFGLYLESFCCGLDAVLSVYRKEVANLEKEIIQDPFLPLTYFLKLEEFHMQFQVLCDLILEIQTEKAHGCQILELIHKRSYQGIPIVELAINKLQQKCLSVLYRQVFCFLMHGYIEDPNKEFFIQLDSVSNEESAKPMNSVLGIESHQKSSKLNYIIFPNLLPSYIPCSLAEKILFVGRYASIINRERGHQMHLVFLKREKIFAKKLMQLSEKPTFSLLHFETMIDDIRSCAAEHLWNIVVKETNLVSHLKMIKDFYLLGKGEFFYSFINEANKTLRMPVTVATSNNANKIFHTTARQLYPDEDCIAEKFNVTVNIDANRKSSEIDKETLSKTKLVSGWSSIGLGYEIPQALYILITPKVIDRYNVIFRFLLAVRKVQMELHDCWALQMHNKGTNHDPMFINIWQLRSHMSSFIDNFQYYLMVDVLESQFGQLLNKFATIKDFETLQENHEQFLTSILSQCFLDLTQIHNLLMEILEGCSSFCCLETRLYVSFYQRDKAQFETLKVNFQRQTTMLFRILLGMRNQKVSPHLAQLLLRIDFSKYLSSFANESS